MKKIYLPEEIGIIKEGGTSIQVIFGKMPFWKRIFIKIYNFLN